MSFQLPHSETPLAQSSVIILPVAGWMTLSQLLAKQAHPADVWQPAELASLTMADLRQLQQFAYQHPVGKEKIAIIPGADQLRGEVANALLKLLEEPPVYLTLVLMAEGNQLLPTIKSRVQFVTFSTEENGDPSKRAQWQSLLESANPENPTERKELHELLYRGALLHPTIQQELLREAFQPTNSDS